MPGDEVKLRELAVTVARRLVDNNDATRNENSSRGALIRVLALVPWVAGMPSSELAIQPQLASDAKRC